MYPIIWTPLINSMSNIGFSDDILDGTNVTFADGICGNNAVVDGDLVYPISDTAITTSGFSLSIFVKLVAGMTVFKYQVGTKILAGIMVDNMNMVIITYEIGIEEYNTLLVMDCHDSIGKWISFVYTYNGEVSNVYINSNYIASSNVKLFDIDADDSISFVFNTCNLFNVKIYIGTISMRQIIEDYFCLLVGYRFDGSGTTNDCLTECDYSGYLHDAVFTQTLILTSTSSPVKPYSTIIPSDISLATEKSTWDSFFINFWVYPVTTTTETQTILKYGNNDSSILSVSILYRENSNPSTFLAIKYSSSDSSTPSYYKSIEFSHWYMVSLSYNSIGFKAYIDCEKVIDVSDSGDFSGGLFTLCSFNGAYSDFRQFLRTPTEEYMRWLYNASTLIDDKGTVCAGNITEVDKEQLTFNNENGFMSKSIEISEGCSNAMKYDVTNKVLTIKDFTEI